MISADDQSMLDTLAELRDAVDNEDACKFLNSVHGRLWEVLDERFGEIMPVPDALAPVNLTLWDAGEETRQ